MNCYNSSKYLKEAIDSVLVQTYTNWEIIFWDNQSTDESASIFKTYKDERMKYFYAPEHTTLGAARNLAAEKASGEWIGFLDCDDIWLPEKLEKQVAIIAEEDDSLGLVYGKVISFIVPETESNILSSGAERYNREVLNEVLPEGNIFNRLIYENFIFLVSGMVKNEFFWGVGGIDFSYKQAEDYDLFVKISYKYKVRAVQEVICRYRIHQNNNSHYHGRCGYEESIKVLEKFNEPEINQAIKTWYTGLAIYEIKQKKITKGFFILMRDGSFIVFMKKLLRILLLASKI
ncbi:MAG: glycosyltransferase [Leptospiraceae bacterium]|nr:glycosyltransferase [Leptospiraceae bacterium]